MIRREREGKGRKGKERKGYGSAVSVGEGVVDITVNVTRLSTSQITHYQYFVDKLF